MVKQTLNITSELMVQYRDCSDHRLGRLGDFRILSDFRFGVDLKVDFESLREILPSNPDMLDRFVRLSNSIKQ